MHQLNGELVVVSLLVAGGWLTWLAVKRRPFVRGAQVLVSLNQVFLIVQALLGIKLLDQGMGVVNLHPLRQGTIPLGFYLIVSWFRFADPVRRARVLAVLVDIGLAGAVMAYLIGQAYVNG